MACRFGRLDCVTVWIKMSLWIKLMTRGAFINDNIFSVIDATIKYRPMMNEVYSYEFSFMTL